MSSFSLKQLVFTLAVLLATAILLWASVTTIGYSRFEEGIAETVASGAGSILDSSSSLNHGTPSGTPIYRADVPVTAILQTQAPNSLSLEFDSSDDKVLFSPQFPFNQSGDATLEFWLKYPGDVHQAVLWGRADCSDTNRFHVYVNPDETVGMDYREPSGALHAVVGGGGPCCGVPVDRNTWTHIAITRVGDTYSLFKDGILMSVQTDATSNLPTASGWSLSGRCGFAFTGSVDEVRISNVALHPGQFLNSRPPNQAPVANAGADQCVFCASPGATQVMLDGSGSSDPDSDTLTYTWTLPDLIGGGSVTGVNPTVTLPLGVHTIKLVVNDGTMDSAPDTVDITVKVSVAGLQSPLAALVPEGQFIPLPLRAFKQGSTLPLKLRMFCGTTALTDADVAPPEIVALIRAGEEVDLSTIDPDAGEANDSGLLFRYSDPNWVYNLSTAGLSTGTYVITIRTPDGLKYNAGFVLR